MSSLFEFSVDYNLENANFLVADYPPLESRWQVWKELYDLGFNLVPAAHKATFLKWKH